MSQTTKLVKAIKENNQDFEWYGTTDEIINTVKQSLAQQYRSIHNLNCYSLLDCGAGDGRILNALKTGDCYAIEKSKILINELDKETYIIGTDFHSTTLIDKEIDVVFCNPPYTEYEQWASKIIQEANSHHIYLVIPQRWKSSEIIKSALKLRNIEMEADSRDDKYINVLGSFDFLNADRAARAKIDVIHIQLSYKSDYRHASRTDPFDIWFNQNFEIKPKLEETEEEYKEKIDGGLVKSGNLIKTLVELYNADMAELSANFATVSQLNASILKELDVNVTSVKKALKQRIKGLKNKYWTELFSNYEVINRRLTSNSLTIMQKRLFSHGNVDFTLDNCYAITGWVIKNANSYFDSQLIRSVEELVSECNVINYKSNHRVFVGEDWRYGRNEYLNTMSDYGLELRCILSGQGGIYDGGFRSYDYINGLGRRGASTVNDLIVIANNLGITCDMRIIDMDNWGDNNNQNVMSDDGSILMNVKAYKNGNLHIKFNQKFMRKLNVEFGRLKGWLKSKEQASEELNIPVDDIDFYSNIKLGGSDLLMLGVD